MGSEEAAAMLPEPGPDSLAVGLRYVQPGQRLAGKELESAFGVYWWERSQPGADFEEEHQPMGLALIAVLTYQAGEVQVRRCNDQTQFLVRLAAGAGVGGFAGVRKQLSAAGAPQAAIGFLGSLQQP